MKASPIQPGWVMGCLGGSWLQLLGPFWLIPSASVGFEGLFFGGEGVKQTEQVLLWSCNKPAKREGKEGQQE